MEFIWGRFEVSSAGLPRGRSVDLKIVTPAGLLFDAAVLLVTSGCQGPLSSHLLVAEKCPASEFQLSASSIWLSHNLSSALQPFSSRRKV